MEYIIQDSSTLTPATLTPAMKRARLLITAAAIFQILWFSTELFSTYYIKIIGIEAYITLARVVTIFLSILFIIGFSQFYFTNNKLYRIAGITLCVGSITLSLTGILGNQISPYDSFSFQFFYLFGISALWFTGHSFDRKILITLASTSIILFSTRFFQMILIQIAFDDTQKAYLEPYYDSIICVYLFYSILYIAQPILWWRFCTVATPDADRSDAGIVQVLLSRPFISAIVCVTAIILTLNFLSQQIFLS